MASWGERTAQPDPRPEARKKATKGEWTMFRKGYSRCLVCPEPFELHHIRPRSQSGSDAAANLAPLCQRHHRVLEDHAPGWEMVAGTIRDFVMASEERRKYQKQHGWESFLRRYPALPGPDSTPGPDDHWEDPADERVSPWEVDEIQPWLGEL